MTVELEVPLLRRLHPYYLYLTESKDLEELHLESLALSNLPGGLIQIGAT